MNTKITYSCKKHYVWNGKKWTKSINRLGGRAFEVTVSGCKTLEECESVLASLEEKLENELRDKIGTYLLRKVDPSFLIITIYDVSQKEDVMGVYKEWKKEYFKRSSK